MNRASVHGLSLDVAGRSSANVLSLDAVEMTCSWLSIGSPMYRVGKSLVVSPRVEAAGRLCETTGRLPEAGFFFTV